MRELTLADLARILRECAGEDEGVDLSGDFGDVPFADLGYDSLAVLETAARLSRDYGVHLSDDDVLDAGTPRKLLQLSGIQIAPAT
ncbi:acyl carrier protein [Streptosporangium sp. NPDC051022]|uniref:acyl carrier protein n=1 Tax=Streptosporangium sp. NPDC051022 TaxID=3155752 RepID=UPI003416FE3F